MTQLETSFEAQQARFSSLDNQMASAAQVATRIGDRLQVGCQQGHVQANGCVCAAAVQETISGANDSQACSVRHWVRLWP